MKREKRTHAVGKKLEPVRPSEPGDHAALEDVLDRDRFGRVESLQVDVLLDPT